MKITPFAFDDRLVRVANKDGEPWFVAKDVCEALGLGNVSRAADKLDRDEKGISSIDTLGGAQELLVVSESGLYALVLRCRDAMTPGSAAHRFRKWVTADVLPSVRKTGSYGLDEARIARITGEAAVAAVQVMLPSLLEAKLAEAESGIPSQTSRFHERATLGVDPMNCANLVESERASRFGHLERPDLCTCCRYRSRAIIFFVIDDGR